MSKHDADCSSSLQFDFSSFIEDDPGDESGDDFGIFDGIADWPDLDEHLHNECRKILQADGISAWKDEGGCLGEDGRWTFGYQSRRGKEVFRELLRSSHGILWTSTCGNTWAVRPIGEDRAHASRAYGVSHPRAVQAVDLVAQIPARRTLEERLRQLRDREQPWTLEDHGEFVHQSQTLLQLYAIENAVRLLPYLRSLATWEESTTLTVTADEAAMWLPDDTDEFDIDALGNALESASQINVAKLQLGRLALGLKVVERTAAVTRFTRRRDEYLVEVNPLLIDVLDAFQAVDRGEDVQ